MQEEENGNKSKATRKVTIRFTAEEYRKIDTAFKNTTKKKLSQYIRFVLLQKPVTVYTRNQSLDNLMAEMILLRNELSASGNNFNQAVKRLHTMSHFSEMKTWVIQNEISKENFFKKMEEIKEKITQMFDKWSPE